LQSGKVILASQVWFPGPADKQESGDRYGDIRGAHLTAQERRWGNRPLTQEAEAASAHVLRSPEDGLLRAFGGIEGRDRVNLNLQYLGKARVSPALYFL